mmetsp:Transcript_7255/g.17703  ORF Transcript_7255/g.17703 Transcript_7255/m.17703 type:complete len:938 (-) Transcript_7255:3057-5870(-)
MSSPPASVPLQQQQAAHPSSPTTVVVASEVSSQEEVATERDSGNSSCDNDNLTKNLPSFGASSGSSSSKDSDNSYSRSQSLSLSLSDTPTPIMSNQSPPTSLCRDLGKLDMLPPPRFSPVDEEPIIVHRTSALSMPSSSSMSSSPQQHSLSPFSVMPTPATPASISNDISRPRSATTSVSTSLLHDIATNILSSLRHGDYNRLMYLFLDLFRSVLPKLPTRGLNFLLPDVGGSGGNNNSTSSSNCLYGQDTQRRNCRRRRRQQPMDARPVRIVGLPNQGQTCFLNSVLQSLASLESFLTYLDDITLYQEGLTMVTRASRSSSSKEGSTLYDDDEVEGGLHTMQSEQSFSRQLLTLLHSINSINEEEDDEVLERNPKNRFFLNRRWHQRVEPKKILKQIGESHGQFKSSYAEQQDAQELLQALLSVVIADGQLEQGSGSGGCGSVSGSNDNSIDAISSDEDELLTSVLAAIDNSSTCLGDDQRDIVSNINIHTDVKPIDDALSLSGFLSVVGEQQKNETDVSNGDSIHSVVSLNPSPIPTYSSHEEKKQEQVDFSHISHHVDGPVRGSNSVGKSFEPQSSKVKAHNLLKKVSSISPSPLSGWIGSTIRCCKCMHVRPIRNAPFFDVPLTPTSIPDFLGRAYGPVKATAPNSPAVKPCSLEQCLADFTSVERVDDVECRNCTIQREIENFEEERVMLKEAVETTEKRILLQLAKHAKNGPSETENPGLESILETKHLREELSKVELRLQQLKTMDPDEDEFSSFDSHGDECTDVLLGLEKGNAIEIERTVAQKCLFFTRMPAILCCHIQRRYFDPFSERMQKCIQSVRFPQILDLSEFSAYNPQATASWAAGSSSPVANCGESKQHDNDMFRDLYSKDKLSYRLQSVIEHRGNAFGGHYISYRRDSSGSWYQISDATVTKVSWKDVQSCQAYMLFYEAI